MTKKQNRKRGFGRRSLSAVLTVLMLLYMLVVMLASTMISVSAAIGYWNVAGDFNSWGDSLNNSAYRINGNSGSVTIDISSDQYSTINFKMCAYEDGWKWCGNGSGSASPGTETELSWNSGNDIALNLPSGTTQVTFKIEVKNGKNYLTASPNGDGGGGGGGQQDTSQMTYSAPVNTSNSANKASDLFWANATYFDYESDKELTDGWLKPVQAGTHNFNGAVDEWYPFYCFNREVVKAQADQHSDWSEPLYLGNFCDTSNAYDSSHHQGGNDSYGYREATNSYNTTRFKHIVNNSGVSWDTSVAHVADDHTSYQGLVNSQLDSNGNLLLPNGQQAPYFNASEDGPLKGYAKVVNSSFPFKVTNVEGKNYKRYTFNSKNATDNVYFTWNTSNGVTYPTGVNYGAGTTYGVQDGVSRFMYNTPSGYGIFPFNNASDNYKGTKTNANENLNYGFGIKTQMRFRVPAPDAVNGINTASDPIYFSFSGDDDLWMYITDEDGNSQLVLDMGGDHKESTGYVNFNTLKATVDKVGTSGNSVTKSFTFDYTKTYTMTVFYMERGLIESNCKMEFTLTPLGNNYIVTEQVDTANVNEGIRDTVKQLSEFGFKTIKGAGATTQISDETYGDFLLGDDDSIQIPDSVLDINSVVKIKQYAPSNTYLKYTTEWDYWDNVANNKLSDNSGSTDYTYNNVTTITDEQTIINESGNEYDFAELQVNYRNTPVVGSFSVKKTVVDDSDFDYSNTEFPFTIYLKFKSDEDFGTYTLQTTDGDYAIGGKYNLKKDQTVTFEGIPVGTRVYVVEDVLEDYMPVYSNSDNDPLIVTESGSDTTLNIINYSLDAEPITMDGIEGTKLLDGELYTGNMFKFVMEGIAPFADDDASVIDTSAYADETASADNGIFGFSDLVFDAPGVYRYHVYEDLSYLTDPDAEKSFDTDFQCENPDFLISITVREHNHELVIDDPVYYSYSRYDDEPQAVEHTMTSADFDPSKEVESIVIKNMVNTGSITVKKENQKGDAVSGVTFAVYKVDEEIKGILNNSNLSENAKYDSIMMYIRLTDDVLPAGSDTTGTDGTAEITDLSIYQDGFVNVTTTGGPNGISVEREDFGGYQEYILVEVSGPDSYSINKTINVFTFPINGQYDFTFSEDRAYVNGAIKNPDASGPGMMILKIVGLAIILFSVAMLGYYVKRNKQKTYQPAHARHMKNDK